MFNHVFVGDECLSKKFGYGIVERVYHDKTFLVPVCDIYVIFENKYNNAITSHTKCTYNSDGYITYYEIVETFGMISGIHIRSVGFLSPTIIAKYVHIANDVKFFSSRIRHILIEKIYK